VVKVRERGSFTMANWNAHIQTAMHQSKKATWIELNCKIRKKREQGIQLSQWELMNACDSRSTTPSLASFGFGKLAKKQHLMEVLQNIHSH
jgi:hypothetical protein